MEFIFVLIIVVIGYIVIKKLSESSKRNEQEERRQKFAGQIGGKWVYDDDPKYFIEFVPDGFFGDFKTNNMPAIGGEVTGLYMINAPSFNYTVELVFRMVTHSGSSTSDDMPFRLNIHERDNGEYTLLLNDRFDYRVFFQYTKKS